MEELRVYYSGGTKWKLKTQLVILVLLHENIIIWNWWLIIIIIHSFCYSFLLIDIHNYQLRWMDLNLNVRFLHTIFSCLLHFWVPSKYYYMRNYSYSVQVVQICTGAFWLDHFSLLYRVLAVLDTYCQYCCVQSGSTIVHPEASDRSVTVHEVTQDPLAWEITWPHPNPINFLCWKDPYVSHPVTIDCSRVSAC